MKLPDRYLEYLKPGAIESLDAQNVAARAYRGLMVACDLDGIAFA